MMLSKTTQDLKKGFNIGSTIDDKMNTNSLVYAVGGAENLRKILLQETLKKFMQMKEIILLHKQNSTDLSKN